MPTSSLRRRDVLILSLWAAAEVGLLLPTVNYARNANEFVHAYWDFFVPMLGVTAILFLVCATLLMVLRPYKPGARVIALALVALLIDAWVQSNYRPWTGDVLNGQTILWTKSHSAFHDLKRVMIMAVAVGLLRWCWSWPIAPIVRFFLVFETLVGAWNVFTLNPETEAMKYHMKADDTLFSFSKDRNVIVILLDCFQGTTFNSLVRADPSWPPSPNVPVSPEAARWRKAFDGFTYFQNSTSSFMSTLYSVPNLLSGALYDNSIPYRSFIAKLSREHNLFRTLASAGVDVSASSDSEWIFSGHLMPWLTQRRPLDWSGAVKDLPLLYDLTLFKAVPYGMKNAVYRDGRWLLTDLARRYNTSHHPGLLPVPSSSKASDIVFLNALKQQGQSSLTSPAFKFIHLRSPHPPFDISPDLKAAPPGDTENEYNRNAQAALNLVTQLLDELRKKGIYDHSFIIVLSDHGLGYDAFPSGKRQHPEGLWPDSVVKTFNYVKGRFLPILLVKPWNAEGPMRVSHAPVTLGDVPQTVVDALHVHADFSGENHMYRSLLSASENDSRIRYARYYMLSLPPDLYVTTQAEFAITGNSWKDESWRFTHRAFPRHQGSVYVSPTPFDKTNFELVLRSQATSYYGIDSHD